MLLDPDLLFGRNQELQPAAGSLSQEKVLRCSSASRMNDVQPLQKEGKMALGEHVMHPFLDLCSFGYCGGIPEPLAEIIVSTEGSRIGKDAEAAAKTQKSVL